MEARAAESVSEHAHRHSARPLAEAIAVATRSIHSRLNKLIVERLPLALPPHASSPAVYVSGILHVAPIYITFEEIWKSLLDTQPSAKGAALHAEPSPASDASDAVPNAQGAETLIPKHVQNILRRLHLPGLMRSDRLKADICLLTGWPDCVAEEHLKTTSQTGRLSEFVQHIQRTLETRPHVILAYAYIMYMALFAGGRIIRSSLESASNEFWHSSPSPIKPHGMSCQVAEPRYERRAGLTNDKQYEEENHTRGRPFQFFYFNTPEDGVDLKREFKARIMELEGTLTARERRDIIQESVCIFDNMMLLVQQLDIANTSPAEETEEGMCFKNLAGLLANSVGSRIRDSVAVAKERSARSSRLSSSDSSICTEPKPIHKSQLDRGRNGNQQNEATHPLMSDEMGIELCPAMSKSMRFEKALPRPIRQATASQKSLIASQSRRLDAFPANRAQIVNWAVAVAFGVFVFGAFYSGIRGIVPA